MPRASTSAKTPSPSALSRRWMEAQAMALAGEDVRLPPAALRSDWAGRFSTEEIETLVVPKRTLARRIANKELLSLDESDRALRLARLTAEADRVFANPEKADRWLRKENRALNHRRPLDLISTDVGARMVEDLLGQIDHGIFT